MTANKDARKPMLTSQMLSDLELVLERMTEQAEALPEGRDRIRSCSVLYRLSDWLKAEERYRAARRA